MDDEGKDLALFKHFKMELFEGGRDGKGGRAVDDVVGIAADNAVQLPLVYVVSLALGHIKSQIVKRLNNSDRVTLRSSDIRWVLTVPAIWSAFGKTFMRAAAYKGGLIDYEHNQEVNFLQSILSTNFNTDCPRCRQSRKCELPRSQTPNAVSIVKIHG